MESTESVSKGVFLFPNGFKKSKISKKKPGCNLFEQMFLKEPWYTTFKRNWEYIENELKELHHSSYSLLLNDVVSYIKMFYCDNEPLTLEGVIPSATLLTGVSQPDHVSQFTALIGLIREQVTPHVALVDSQDGPSVKHLVENVVWQLIYGQELDSTDEEDTEDVAMETKKKLKKNQCTMKVLKNWYHTKYTHSPKKKSHTVRNKSLVVIIPDFESFNCNVLQDFVMIVSSYVSSLPIILVFGVATSVSALHKSFPYQVSSKLLIKVFHSHSSPVYLNQVLENIFLTHTCPFHLSGKTFELLMDVFLFYDFSVTGLIQSIKFCMMDHYYGDNIKALCCQKEELEEVIINLTAEDLENVRKLTSFRPFLESQDCRTKISLLEDDSFFRNALYKQMLQLHDYMYTFYMCVRLLAAFVKDLPNNALGKTVREIYIKCASECITSTPAFKECMQLLSFQSQTKLVESIKNALKVVNSYLKIASPAKPLRSTPSKSNLHDEFHNNDLGENFAKTIRVHLLTFLRQIENANTETSVAINSMDETENDMEMTPGSRYKLKEKLLKATRVEKIQSELELVRARLVTFVHELVGGALGGALGVAMGGAMGEGRGLALLELLRANAPGARARLLGAPRAALHTALTHPAHYLQCSCCQLWSVESTAGSLPDICVAYKLHRECGRHINLFDWLQAFAAVMRPDDNDDQRHHDAELQLRFTRAVSELQFLGFIKSSKRKTDHVMRLTW